MADEAKEVSPFSMNKNFKSTAPDGDKVEDDPASARAVMPVMFTKPGEDVYASDDPTAAPIYSDFRASILPADSDVPAGVEVTDPDELDEEEEIPSVPKDLSALASAASSGFRASIERQRESQKTSQLQTVLPDDLPQTVTVTPTLPASGSDAVKDSGMPKVNESSTPTSSLTPTQTPGKNEPPA